MRILPALLLLALLAPSASACLDARGQAVAPLLDMDFPEKQRCKAPDHSDCTPAPQPGQPFEMDGTLRWSWDVDNCEAANLAFSVDPIVITFPPFPRNPSWLRLTIEPAEIQVAFQEQWDLLDDSIDPATQKVRVQEDFPIKVRVERVGEPTAEELARAESKNGVVEVYAKAVSSQTEGFQPGFAFENFRFDATAVTDPATREASDVPAPSFAWLALGLAGLAVALRRR